MNLSLSLQENENLTVKMEPNNKAKLKGLQVQQICVINERVVNSLRVKYCFHKVNVSLFKLCQKVDGLTSRASVFSNSYKKGILSAPIKSNSIRI